MPWKPDYITVAAASAFLRIPVGDTTDDTEVQQWVTSASRAIDDWCNRQFGQIAAPASRVYRRAAVYDATLGLWCLEIDDVQNATGLTINGTSYASSGAVLLPDNAPAETEPWTRLGFTSRPTLPYPGVSALTTVVAQWGWSTVPVQVTAAMRLQVGRWNFRRDAPAGVAGSPDSGSEVRLGARLDPDVKTTLLGLRRRRRVA
jgi:hypothetical protein